MKLNKYIGLAALPLLFVACQEDVLVENQQLGDGKFVLNASVDKEGSFSRAQIKLEDQGDGTKYGAFQWDENDKFRLFEISGEGENAAVSASHDFSISDYSNSYPSTSAKFVSTTTPTDGSKFYAYYPCLDWDEVNETMTITIDQKLTNNSPEAYQAYFNKNMLMLAEGEIHGTETTLNFEHQCGLISVSYTNESTEIKSVKGISLNGEWGISKTFKLTDRWAEAEGTVKSDGYGITFENPVAVQAGETKDFFILFMEPVGLNKEPVRMNQLSIVYSDGDAEKTLTTDVYSISMPYFHNGGGYRLNVKETTEGKLVWTKAPVLDGSKVGTLAELVAALQNEESNIVLSANIALEAPLSIKHAVTLDLAGFAISMNQNKLSEFKESEDALIVVHRGGDLTINDATSYGSIEPGIDYPTSTIKMVGNDDEGESLAKLTLNGGNLAGYNVISGTKGKGNTEIVINGGYINGGWDIDMETGKGATGIFHPQAGTLTINGGSIRGCQSSVEMRAGNLIFNGGEISYNQDWRPRHEPTTVGNGDGTTMRACVALGISQGDDNLPLNVTVGKNANFNVQGEHAYAIYEVDLHDNNTDNVTISIEGSNEEEMLNIPGHIYSENKKGFIGSYTRFDSPSCLGYIAAGVKGVNVECNYNYSGPAACILDSEEGNGAEVTVRLNGKTWKIESGDDDKTYFNIGKNNQLFISDGTINVPDDELTVGGALMKGTDSSLRLINMTLNSYKLYAAIDVENGECYLENTTINVADGCSAFKIKSDVSHTENNVVYIERGEVIGNFEVDIFEEVQVSDKTSSILQINNSTVNGHLYIGDNLSALIKGDETTGGEYAQDMFSRLIKIKEVVFADGNLGWNWGETVPDQELPETFPETMITDLAWIAVLEQSLANCEDLEGEFVKTDAGYLDVAHETNSALISQMSVISVDGSEITELKFIDRFTSLATLSIRNSKLTSLDLSKNTSLQTLDCAHNALTSLNVENCQSLRELNCANNNLTVLDVSKNTYLTKLTCGGNSQLATLTLNQGLKELYLKSDGDNSNLYSNSALTEIDLSDFTSLKVVDLMYNLSLESVDLTGLTKLETLDITNLPISEINLKDNTALAWLKADWTENLKTIDLSENKQLNILIIENAGLTSLDLTSNVWLNFIQLRNLHLSILDLSTMQSESFDCLYCGHQEDEEGNLQELKLILNTRWKTLWDEGSWGDLDENLNVNCFSDLNKGTGGSDFDIKEIY